MLISIAIIVIAALFTSVITFVYLPKEKVVSSENVIYKYLTILSLVNLLFEFLLCLNVLLKPDLYLFFNTFLTKPFLVALFLWYMMFAYYLLSVIFFYAKLNNTLKKKLSRAFTIFVAAVCLLILLLPVHLVDDGKYAYASGLAINVMFAVDFTVFIVLFIAIIIYLKHIPKKKIIPVIALMLCMGIVMIFRVINPGILLNSFSTAFTTFLMYFTIENPDMKLLGELYKNKNIMEQTYDDKSNFLFAATQEVKQPLLNITNLCNELKDEENMNKLKEGLGRIRTYTKQLDFVLNDVLDISSLSSQTIKFIDNKYDLSRLYEEVVSRVNAILPRTVKFTSKKPYEIPLLYGDSIKLKQVITSILQNSVKNTKSGFIEFNIDTIERYDAIRLIITIRDSSDGIPIDKINEILTITGNLDVQDVKDLEQNEINLKLCGKVVKLMGGNMMIRSDENKGTEVSLIIDQKIALEKVDEKISIYENLNKTTKNVIVVNQDKSIEEILKLKLKENNITTSYLLSGDALIDKIKSGREYDYIIVGDELKGINGINILRKLNQIEGFKTPVIIILDKNKENLANHYLKEGFDNYILPSNFEEDLNKVISKY